VTQMRPFFRTVVFDFFVFLVLFSDIVFVAQQKAKPHGSMQALSCGSPSAMAAPGGSVAVPEVNYLISRECDF
jgi:hypothetical protein